MKEYLKLIRCKHYIKNILVFFPLFFSKNIFNFEISVKAIIGFVLFCLISSIVYIFNDIMDLESDKQHPIKKNRPLASGKISIKKAYVIMCVLSVTAIILSIYYFRTNLLVLFLLLLYICINILYSIKLKNIPIMDIIILCIGFLIRIFYGAVIIDVEISNWLYLTILSLAFYMALGKRRNELLKIKEDNTREVLQYYNNVFLNNNMYMFLALSIVFYSLWCIDMVAIGGNNLIWTVLLVMIICMRYSYQTEQENSFADPIEVILEDKVLLFLTLLLAVILVLVIYF